MATFLVGVVGLSAMTGVQFATQRLAAARANQQVVSWVSQELSNLQSQGQRGALSTSMDVTTTRDFPGVRGATLQILTGPSAEAANVVVAGLIATYNDGQPRSVTVDTQIFNNRLPRVVGIKFSPSSVPAPAADHFLGFFPSANWNRVSSVSGTVTGLLDHQGSATPVTLSTSTAALADITGNVNLSGATAAGERFEQLYRGGVASSENFLFLVLFNIPYPRYDLFVYINLPAIGSGQDATLQLNSGPVRIAPLATNLADDARQTFVLNRNVFVFSNQTNPTAIVGLNGTTLAPPLHGIQIIERN